MPSQQDRELILPDQAQERALLSWEEALNKGLHTIKATSSKLSSDLLPPRSLVHPRVPEKERVPTNYGQSESDVGPSASVVAYLTEKYHKSKDHSRVSKDSGSVLSSIMRSRMRKTGSEIMKKSSVCTDSTYSVHSSQLKSSAVRSKSGVHLSRSEVGLSRSGVGLVVKGLGESDIYVDDPNSPGLDVVLGKSKLVKGTSPKGGKSSPKASARKPSPEERSRKATSPDQKKLSPDQQRRMSPSSKKDFFTAKLRKGEEAIINRGEVPAGYKNPAHYMTPRTKEELLRKIQGRPKGKKMVKDGLVKRVDTLGIGSGLGTYDPVPSPDQQQRVLEHNGGLFLTRQKKVFKPQSEARVEKEARASLLAASQALTQGNYQKGRHTGQTGGVHHEHGHQQPSPVLSIAAAHQDGIHRRGSVLSYESMGSFPSHGSANAHGDGSANGLGGGSANGRTATYDSAMSVGGNYDSAFNSVSGEAGGRRKERRKSRDLGTNKKAKVHGAHFRKADGHLERERLVQSWMGAIQPRAAPESVS